MERKNLPDRSAVGRVRGGVKETRMRSRDFLAGQRLARAIGPPRLRRGERADDLLVYLRDLGRLARIVRIPDPRVAFMRFYREMNPGAVLHPISSATRRAKSSRLSE
jgi:hypothetical protein